MTNREAALKSCEDRIKHLESAPLHHYGKRQQERAIELERVKISALRPITREQVEKVFSGCKRCKPLCTACKNFYKGLYPHECASCKDYDNFSARSNFCEKCGRPLTDEALEMVLDRLEALNDEL